MIDVNSGYQRLCGQNALDYVRYRHTDTDLVRAARQQDFLSQARRQVPAGEVIPILGGNLGSDLLDIFTEYTSSDIDNTDQIIGTLKAFLAVRNVPVKRVSFDGTLEESYVTATPEQLEKAVDEFLGGEDTAGPTGGEGATDEKKGKKDDKKKEEEGGPDGRLQPDLGRGRVARVPGVGRGRQVRRLRPDLGSPPPLPGLRADRGGPRVVLLRRLAPVRDQGPRRQHLRRLQDGDLLHDAIDGSPSTTA